MGVNCALTPPFMMIRLLHAQGLCTEYLSSPFKKGLFVCHCHYKPMPGIPQSPTSWQVHILSGSQPVSAHLLYQLHMSLGYPKFSGNIPAGDCRHTLGTPMAVSLAVIFPPSTTLCTRVSPDVGLGLLCPWRRVRH